MLRTNQLLGKPTPRNMAELSWRLGLALAAFNLVLLALVLSATNPRAGRGYSMVFALLAFIAYYNLLNAGFGWISSGKLSFTQLMLGLHGGVLAATCLLLTIRNSNWSLRDLLPRKAITS
jgi:lipopolysaccharide export system permease protein